MPDESYTDRHIWLSGLYQEQWEPMVRLAVLLLGGPDVTATAEEIVRDALVTMYRRDPTLHSWPHAVGYLRASVVNGVRVDRIEPCEGGVHILHVSGEGAPEGGRIAARKVVLATGIQGGGEWHTPAMIR